MKERSDADGKTSTPKREGNRGLLALLVSSSVLAEPAGPQTVAVAENERWWAGVISQSHLMPLHDRAYTFDSYGDTAGNQVQPLLISDQGRYIWSDDPFRFEFRGKTIHLSARLGTIQTGQAGSTLKEVYQHVSRHLLPLVADDSAALPSAAKYPGTRNDLSPLLNVTSSR